MIKNEKLIKEKYSLKNSNDIIIIPYSVLTRIITLKFKYFDAPFSIGL